MASLHAQRKSLRTKTDSKSGVQKKVIRVMQKRNSRCWSNVNLWARKLTKSFCRRNTRAAFHFWQLNAFRHKVNQKEGDTNKQKDDVSKLTAPLLKVIQDEHQQCYTHTSTDNSPEKYIALCNTFTQCIGAMGCILTGLTRPYYSCTYQHDVNMPYLENFPVFFFSCPNALWQILWLRFKFHLESSRAYVKVA